MPQSMLEFHETLLDGRISSIEIVRKYIVHGAPYVFLDNEGLYFELKNDISSFFGVNPHDIFMVGSAKMGFSIARNKLWKVFDDESDIDMVIVSNIVFDDFWKELYDFNIDLTSRTIFEDQSFHKFLYYFFKGWIRPDLFPFNYGKRSQWFDFFRSLSYGKYGWRKISCAVYRDSYFFERYHEENVKKIRMEA